MNSSLEWLEADGLGGFASGTSTGIRTRRYHALLLAATTPPTGRMVLVNGLDAWVETPEGKFSVTSQCYAPDVIGGDGANAHRRLRLGAVAALDFQTGRRHADRAGGIRCEKRTRDLRFLESSRPAQGRQAVRRVRFFPDATITRCTKQYSAAVRCGNKTERVVWQPYTDVPAVAALSNGEYSHQPLWYYNFLYEEEQARGLDCEEDLAAPGVFSWDLSKQKAALIFTTREHAAGTWSPNIKPFELLMRLRDAEKKRRETFPSRATPRR